MPFDPNAWKRQALAHYLELAQIDMPGAMATARNLAAAAEAASCGALTGLADKVRELTQPQEEQGSELRSDRKGPPRRRGHG